MVAGFASVPGIGWGIMVPQPKSEVEKQVYGLLRSHFIWALVGLVLAVILAITLVNWITRPINQLSRAAKRLSQNAFDGELPKITRSAPRELVHLGDGLRGLIEGLQASRNEVNKMNETLQQRVDDSTRELRKANSELNRIASSDYLTSLSSRRYFEEKLNLNLGRRHTDNDDLSLLLIDLDNFKEVNDQYGHSAGDTVLVQMASLLNSTMNEGDMLARYGGDEIVAKLGCDAKAALMKAEYIRKTVHDHKFMWNNISIHMTVSIGVLYCTNYRSDDFNMLLNKVDIALYEAKKTGRNTVVEFKMKTVRKGADIYPFSNYKE
jgi:diguanylate cyclase (GGDEF)-like protein